MNCFPEFPFLYVPSFYGPHEVFPCKIWNAEVKKQSFCIFAWGVGADTFCSSLILLLNCWLTCRCEATPRPGTAPLWVLLQLLLLTLVCVYVHESGCQLLWHDRYFITVKAVRTDRGPACLHRFQVAHTHKFQFVLVGSSSSVLLFALHLFYIPDYQLCAFNLSIKHKDNSLRGSHD